MSRKRKPTVERNWVWGLASVLLLACSSSAEGNETTHGDTGTEASTTGAGRTTNGSGTSSSGRGGSTGGAGSNGGATVTTGGQNGTTGNSSSTATTGGDTGATGGATTAATTGSGTTGRTSGASNDAGMSATTGSSGTTGANGSSGTTSSTADAGSDGGSSSTTCPAPALSSGDNTKRITVGGLNREYILHVPSGYKGTSAAPLVIDFHPIGGSDSSWRSGSPYPSVLDKEGVILAYPNGEPSPNLGNAWNVEGCCVSKINGADVDDVAFAKAIVSDIEKIACIDPKRVYAVGFSMGGGMSNYLACHAADVFAAVGPASFDLTQQNAPDCKPARPITVIEWRGKNDNVVPYAGGHSALVTGMAIDFLGAVGTFQKWADLDGCTGSPGAADSNNCQSYSACSNGVQVTLCTDNGGGHEAAKADVVWPMLKKYTLP